MKRNNSRVSSTSRKGGTRKNYINKEGKDLNDDYHMPLVTPNAIKKQSVNDA